MKKDYIKTTLNSDEETKFIENFWTEVWDKAGGVKDIPDNVIEKTEEFQYLSPYLKMLNKETTILDGGCGRGEWVVGLRKKGYRTIGVDLSQKTISNLKSRYPDNEFIAGDIRNLDLPSNSIDVYISWGVFEHFENGMQDCLSEAWRILKEDGLLVISIPFLNKRHLSNSAKFNRSDLSNHSDYKGLKFYQWRFTREELFTELKRSGFDVLEIIPISHLEGVRRMIHHSTGLSFNSIILRITSIVLSKILPKANNSHMLLAISKKRNN